MKAFSQKKFFKKYFTFLCFFILCICDHRIGSASGEIQLVCPNIVLMVLSCIALSHYPLPAFRRRWFLVPAGACGAAALLVLYFILPHTYYPYQAISGAIAGVLYGCVLIQTVFGLVSRKGLPGGNRLGGGLLGLLLVLVLLSRHDKYNGALLCLSVVLLYLTDFTAQECEWLLKSLGGAVLAAFFVFQGLAFVFRPYDSLRYLGLYANTNMNALFYQMAYCVFLSGFCILEFKKQHCFLKWASFCFACAMWPFVLLTMCRSALLGMAAATVLGFGIILWKNRWARLGRWLLCACGLVLGSILSFPVVYGAVRYLPAVFHHPVWFMDEYSEEKVHSWDPYDSEKYTGWRDVLQENFGRFFPGTAGGAGFPEADANLPQVSGEPGTPPFGAAPGEEWMFGTAPDGEEAPVQPDSPALGPGQGEEDSPGPGEGSGEALAPGYSVSARFTIYRHYLNHLNLLGHREDENGVWVDGDYFAPHAHNVVLQYAFNYGLPAGVLFFVYLAASGIRFLALCTRKETDAPYLLGLLLFASVAAFGMMEIIWRNGQLSHTLLLLLPRFAWQYGAGTAGRKAV